MTTTTVEPLSDVDALADFIADLPQQTRPTVLHATDLELAFRHSGWAARREKVRDTLGKCGTPHNVLERFDNCGATARVAWSPSHRRHYVRGSYCKNRHCVPCMNAKAKLIAGNITNRLKTAANGRYRFGTLTLLHCNEPLPDQVKRLHACFAKLRKTKIFKTQAGGAWTWECKIGKDGRWHPHIHFISEGSFMHQGELSIEWMRITGNSPVCDIRQVRDPANVGHELTKYITKGTSASVWDDEQKAVEWVIAVRGQRTCGTWGTWRRFKLTEKSPLPDDLIDIGSLDSIMIAARAGETWAVYLVDELMPGEVTGPSP